MIIVHNILTNCILLFVCIVQIFDQEFGDYSRSRGYTSLNLYGSNCEMYGYQDKSTKENYENCRWMEGLL